MSFSRKPERIADFKRLFWLELDDLVEDWDDDPRDFDVDEDLEEMLGEVDE